MIFGFSGGLPLELQIGLLHLVEGEPQSLPRLRFERYVAVFESGQSPFPIAPALHGIPQSDPGFLALETLVVLRLEELAFHSGRADFERILAARDDVFDIQNSAYLLRDELAIAMRYAIGLVDGDPDEAVHAASFDLDLNH